MDEQGTSKHGAREDDELKREVRSDLLANRATRSQEWLEAQPSGEDEPEATWALAAHTIRRGRLADSKPADMASPDCPNSLAELELCSLTE